MRFLLLLAGLGVTACVTAAPRDLCACQPSPSPGPAPMIRPLPLMDDAQFAHHVAELIEGVCAASADGSDGWDRRPAAAEHGLAPEGPDQFVLRMETSQILLDPPNQERNTCRLIVTGPTARITTVDQALKTWAAGQPMTWNIRDNPFGVTPDVNNTRIRGIADRGESQLRWEYVPDADPAEPAELRVEWTPAVS